MTDKKERIAILDFDSATFYSSKDTAIGSIENIEHRINEILEETKATKFLICLTGGGQENFRYTVDPSYKSNRRKRSGTPLKYLKMLKAYLIEEHNALIIRSLESDDTCVYYANQLKNVNTETILCSPDKDLLMLLGTHFNYSYKMINKGKDDEYLETGRWVTTTQTQADRFFAKSLLVGDVGDAIPGIKERTKYMRERYGLDARSGVGEVTANKILDIIEQKYDGEYAREISFCYNSKYKDTEEATAIEQGLADYNMNRYLLHLNPEIGRYNKILAEYSIDEHIQTVQKENINEVEDF